MSITIHQNLRTSKQSCEKIVTMLIFDVSHMTENIWRYSIFQASSIQSAGSTSGGAGGEPCSAHDVIIS